MLQKKESRKSVAVLCTAYNGVKYLERQLRSIMDQEGVLVNIYLSADVSSDGTYELCEKWALENTNISFLAHGEKFGGAAKNFYRLIRDVDFSGYEYVALADQDDIWFGDKLQRSILNIETKQADAYSSNVTAFWSDGKEQLVEKSQPQTEYDFFFEAAGPGCTYVFKSNVLMLFKEFLLENERQVEKVALHDWLLYAFCRSRGKSWFIDSEPTMLYRQHSSNQVGSNTGAEAFLKRFAMVKGKWYREEVGKMYTMLGDTQPHFSLKRSFLVFNFWKLRRRVRDKIILLVFMMLGLF